VIGVAVTDHARWRAAERFRGFDAACVEEEVLEALTGGRVSAAKPRGLAGAPDPKSLYCWTPDGQRCYALRQGRDAVFVVTTCMRVASSGEVSYDVSTNGGGRR
jgi:hypothetical protein